MGSFGDRQQKLRFELKYSECRRCNGVCLHRPPKRRPNIDLRDRYHSRTRDKQTLGRDDWDAYGQLLRLYLAGIRPSPSLLALKDETDAYYAAAGDYGT